MLYLAEHAFNRMRQTILLRCLKPGPALGERIFAVTSPTRWQFLVPRLATKNTKSEHSTWLLAAYRKPQAHTQPPRPQHHVRCAKETKAREKEPPLSHISSEAKVDLHRESRRLVRRMAGKNKLKQLRQSSPGSQSVSQSPGPFPVTTRPGSRTPPGCRASRTPAASAPARSAPVR